MELSKSDWHRGLTYFSVPVITSVFSSNIKSLMSGVGGDQKLRWLDIEVKMLTFNYHTLLASITQTCDDDDGVCAFLFSFFFSFSPPFFLFDSWPVCDSTPGKRVIIRARRMPSVMRGVQSNDSNYFLARSFGGRSGGSETPWNGGGNSRNGDNNKNRILKGRWVCRLKRRGNTLFIKLYT